MDTVLHSISYQHTKSTVYYQTHCTQGEAFNLLCAIMCSDDCNYLFRTYDACDLIIGGHEAETAFRNHAKVVFKALLLYRRQNQSLDHKQILLKPKINVLLRKLAVCKC